MAPAVLSSLSHIQWANSGKALSGSLLLSSTDVLFHLLSSKFKAYQRVENTVEHFQVESDISTPGTDTMNLPGFASELAGRLHFTASIVACSVIFPDHSTPLVVVSPLSSPSTNTFNNISQHLTLASIMPVTNTFCYTLHYKPHEQVHSVILRCSSVMIPTSHVCSLPMCTHLTL